MENLSAFGLLIVLLLSGCASTGLQPTEHYSGFDDARIVHIEPHGNACDGMVCTGFGLQWSSKYPNQALMIVQTFNASNAILGAQLNIDGRKIDLKDNQLFTDISIDKYVQNSAKAFQIELDVLKNISEAERVWMRVNTPSGDIEDPIIEGGKKSKSYFALNRFLEKL